VTGSTATAATYVQYGIQSRRRQRQRRRRKAVMGG